MPPHSWIESISIVDLPEDLLSLVDTQAIWQPHMATSPAPPELVELWRQLAWKDVLGHLAGPIAEGRWRRLSRWSIKFNGPSQRDWFLGDTPHAPGTDMDRVRVHLRWAFPKTLTALSIEHGSRPRSWSRRIGKGYKWWAGPCTLAGNCPGRSYWRFGRAAPRNACA